LCHCSREGIWRVHEIVDDDDNDDGSSPGAENNTNANSSKLLAEESLHVVSRPGPERQSSTGYTCTYATLPLVVVVVFLAFL
jgi:hypothetical protein